jgi:hypothetical protein
MTNSYTTGPNLFRKFLLAGVTLALSVLFSVSSWGQLGANYAFNASAGTYSSISATGTAVGAAILADDGAVNITGLSPGFVVNSVTYTNARMCSNGWLALYTTAPTTSTSYASLSTAMTNGAVIICPFNGDQNGTGAFAWRQSTGTEHIFEWQNFYRFGATGESLNYQIRLNTSTGAISFVYGNMTAGTGTGTPQIGFKTTGTTAANWATDVNNLLINATGSPNTCTWADAVTGNANNSTMYLNTANPLVKPASGQTFTWTPQASPAPVRTFSAVSGITSSGATIAWTAPTGATSYQLQYRAVGQCAWTTFGGAVSAAGTALTGLTDGTSYQVRVRSSNGSVFSIWSHIPTSAAGAGLNGYVAAGTFTTLALPPTVTGFTPNQPLCASGGQTVVITGSSFIAGSVPRFNGTNATGVVINSTTQITCVTPVGITAGNITVQTTAGTSATGAANAYTLSANPVVSLSPSSAVAPCGSFPTTVTASNTATALSTTYAWSDNATLSAATGSTVNVTTTSNQSYVVTATDSRGCTGTATLTATVATPTAVTVTPSIPYFCGTGSAVNISATSANTNYVYTFSVVDFGTISNVAASTCDFTVSQTSALKTRAVDAAGACATDVYTSIGVYPFPSPSMTATPDTICAGSTTDLGSGLSAGNFSVASIPWAANTAPGTATALMNNGTASVALSGGSLDDGGWAGIPLGFSFNYFGTAFTTVACGTNGLVMFGTVPGYTTAAGQLGQYNFSGTAASCTPAGPATGRFFPNCNNPGNVIALMAADGNAGTSTAGNIKYWTSGYAPNRIFNLKYDTYRFFGSTSTYTAALRLYETTGIVEIFIDEKQLANQAIVGLQDATKLIGAVAPNRPTNPVTNAVANWTVTSGSGEAWRFSPPSNYTTAWTPSGSINGTASGTNLFTRTTNALSTLGLNTFNLVVTDQTTGCSNSASPASVSVRVLAVPSVPASADVTGYGSILGAGSAAQSALTICGEQTVTVNYGGTLNPLEVVRWYSTATGGTPLATGLSYTTPSLTAGDTIYVEIANPKCASPSRFLFDIDYNVPPAISIASNGPDNDVNCGVGPAYTMGYTVSSSNGGYSYTWTNDGIADTFSPSGANVTLTTDTTTNTTVTAFDAGTGCSISSVKPLSIYDFPNIVPASTDSIICIGDSTTVSSGVEVANFSVACATYGWKTPPAGSVQRLVNNGVTDVALTSGTLDDGGWGGVPIGFTFDFFGVDYTTLNVGTNGNVMFGTYNGNSGFVSPNGLGDYSFAGFPSTTEPLGVIALCATDLYLTTSGRVRYWTEGVSPNRIFVLEYNNVPGFITNGSHSMQLHLFETTGKFQIHVAKATGTGLKTIGVNSPTGLVGATAQVCNIAPVGSVRWNANSSQISASFPWAWQFNPPVDYTFAWSPAGEVSGPTNSANIVAYPTATAPGTQNYSIQVTDNVSGCVGTPVSYPVQIVDFPELPNIVGYGLFSEQDSTNGTTFCGPQGVEWYCSDALAPGWQVVYYTQAVGGTGFPFDATDTLTFTTGSGATLAVAQLSANDTIWAALNNGSCDGPRREVIFTYQDADTIAISNSNPINCGPSTATYTSTLVASSAAAYSYTWGASPALDTTTGATVTATINNTLNFTVTGTDGFCYANANSSVSRYNFPTVVPTAEFDSVCPGGTSVIYSNTSASNFNIQSKGYSPDSESGTVTFLCTNGVENTPLNSPGFPTLDDGGWIGVPIGFPFNFLGTEYSTVNVSTNGNIQFGTSGTFSDGFTAVTIPSPSVPNNFIAPFWGDLDMRSNSGEPSSIRYWVSGAAPNRAFNVKFDGVRFFQALTSRYSGQVALNEATGQIELDIQEVTHGGFSNTVMGAENIDGTIGGSPTGRANGTWQITSPEGWILSPPADYSFNWLPSGEIDGATNLDTAVASPSVSTQYQLIVTDNATTCDNSVTNQTYVTVGVASAAPVAAFTISDNTPTTGGVLQTVTLTATTPELGGETYLWNISPATFNFVGGTNALSRNPQVQFTAPGFYSVTFLVTSCTGTNTLTLNNSINATAVYCFPSFSTACQFGDEIGDVEIFNPAGQAIMSHLATGCTTDPDGYEVYAPINGLTSCTFYQGSTYSIEVSSAYLGDYFGAWLDVNNDGDFDDALEFLGSSATPGDFASFELGIPSSNVVYGAHKMRILCVDNGAPLVQADACINEIYGECHDYTVFIQPPVILNDIPQFAVSVQNSTNLTYPTCYAFTGNTALATNSPETANSVISGRDTWYRFTAQSTAVSIKVTSSSMDDIIALYSRDAGGNYILVASENVGVGNGDFEQLNVDGLTAGTQYWIAVGSNSGGGAFSICIQNLMRSGCNTVTPVAGLRLCDSYRATYRGAPSQGVTYTFNFTPTGVTPGSATSVSGTNGLITLSNPTLALRYGGVYDVDVDVTYTLANSAGTPEIINVSGLSTDPRCTGVTLQAHPNLEVRSNQRCPATLLRSNFLVGTTVAGSTSSFICGAINYTYRMSPVVSCADGTSAGLAAEYTTNAASPYLPLGVLANLSANAGAWDVEIRPNFSYGAGSYGPVQRILVNNTAAGSELEEGSVDGSEKVSTFVAANLYPNPNNGEMVNLNVAGIESDNVFVRITDAMGRIVYTNRFTVDGSLNTIVTFAEPLASGIYNVEFTVDGQIMTERMIVAKQ